MKFRDSISSKMLDYGKKPSSNIGLRLLKSAERNIVIKSYLYKIEGMSPDDIAQELRIEIWRKRNKYDPKKGSMSTFTNLLIRGRLKDLRKHSKRKKEEYFFNDVTPLTEISDLVEDKNWQGKFIEGIGDKGNKIWGG